MPPVAADATRNRRSAPIDPRRSPSLSLPLPHLLAGLGAFVLAAAAVPWLAPDLLLGYYGPHQLALVHLITLGWITMVIVGALYQLLPVGLGAPVRAPRLARANLALLAVGIGGFVPSFYRYWTPGIAAFGTAAVAGLLIAAGILAASFRGLRAWNAMAWYVASALGWLALTVLAGLTYALNAQEHWFPTTPARLAAHAHLGLVGWFGLTLAGVSYKLLPMFALSHGHGERVAKANLVLANAALAGLALSLAIAPDTALPTAFAAALAVAAAVFVGDQLAILRLRRRRRITLEQRHLAVSLASLLLAATLGVMIAAGHAPAGPTGVVTYGYALMIGWLGFAIVGRLYKIIPFLLWVHRYSGQAGGRPVPLLADMLDERAGNLSWAALTAGYAGVLVGLLEGSEATVRVAGSLFAIGALIFAGAILHVLVHRPEPAPRPTRSNT